MLLSAFFFAESGQQLWNGVRLKQDLEKLDALTGIAGIDAGSLTGLTLAYVGDAVYELILRTYMTAHSSKKVEKLHRHVTALVNAAAQSELIRLLEPELNETELAIYRRGRNAKSMTPAKHQKLSDYRRATGLEALMGYLYLEQDFDRIAALLTPALPRLILRMEELAAEKTAGEAAGERANEAASERFKEPLNEPVSKPENEQEKQTASPKLSDDVIRADYAKI